MYILLTGSTSGIGLAVLEELLTRGHTVFAGARNPDSIQKFQASFPKSFFPIKLDVCSQGDIDAAVETIRSTVEQLGTKEEFVLINNAGIAVGGPFEALPIAEWRRLFDINVFGLVNLTQKFLFLLRKTKGRVINIGSISGRIASPFLAPYAASKFAVRAISDSLRREMLPFGVQVILIEPGPTQSAIWDRSMDTSMAIKRAMPPEIEEIYGPAIDKVMAGVKKTAESAAPVSWVVAKVVEAVESKNPPVYNLVGRKIHLMNFLNKVIPVKLLDRILIKGFRGQN